MNSENSPDLQSAPANAPQWIAIQTAPAREFDVRDALAELGAEETFLPALQSRAASRATRANSTARPPLRAAVRPPLLFNRYVFLRFSPGGESFLESIHKIEGVRRVLGKSPHEPSRVEPGEIAVLRELCSAAPPPHLIPLPEAGKRVQIQSGLMAGATGVVLRANRSFTVLAFSMPILAGAYEVTVPTNQLLDLGPLSASQAAPAHSARTRKKTHRAGRRVRRASKSKKISSIPPDSAPANPLLDEPRKPE